MLKCLFNDERQEYVSDRIIVRIILIRPDVTLTPLRTRHTALVGSGTASIRARVNGGTARAERHGLGETSIVRKCAQLRIT